MLPKISHPTLELTVPSTKTKIRLRPILVKEEKRLLMAKASENLTDFLDSIKETVNSCLVSPKLDVNSLALFDLEYIFVKLRASSINNIQAIKWPDPEDGKTYDLEFDFNKVEIKWPEDKPKDIVKVSDTISLQLRYPRARIFSDAEFANDEANPDYFMAQVIDKIIEGEKIIDAKNVPMEELKGFIDEMPIPASEAINAFWRAMPSVFYEVKYTNSKGTEQSIKFQTLTDFFPFR